MESIRPILWLLLLSNLSLFAQPFSFRDPAFLAAVTITNVAAGGEGSTLTNGLLFHYDMDEASGTRAETLGGTGLGVSSTIYQSNGIISSSAAAIGGGVLSASTETMFEFGDADWTIACWTRFMPSGNVGRKLISKTLASGTNEVELDWNASALTLTINAYTNYANPYPWALSGLTSNTWYFLCLQHEAASDTLSLNYGTQTEFMLASNRVLPVSLVAPTNAGFGVLGKASVASIIAANIDELAKWSRVLTLSEVTNLWKAGTNGTTYPYTGY